MDFCGDGALVHEIERNLRLDDRVLKYMTVLKDNAVDMEALEAELEAAKEQTPKPEPVEEATGEGEEKGDSEPTGTGEASVTEADPSENTPETSNQEEQENGTI
jgi:small subunit ribosomal protein S6